MNILDNETASSWVRYVYPSVKMEMSSTAPAVSVAAPVDYNGHASVDVYAADMWRCVCASAVVMVFPARSHGSSWYGHIIESIESWTGHDNVGGFFRVVITNFKQSISMGSVFRDHGTMTVASSIDKAKVRAGRLVRVVDGSNNTGLSPRRPGITSRVLQFLSSLFSS